MKPVMNSVNPVIAQTVQKATDALGEDDHTELIFHLI